MNNNILKVVFMLIDAVIIATTDNMWAKVAGIIAIMCFAISML